MRNLAPAWGIGGFHLSKTIALAVLVGLVLTISTAEAKNRRHRHYHLSFPPPTASAIVLEAETKRILFENSADARVRPASLTKMMTLYLTFGQLAQGKLHPNDALPVSRYAAGRAAQRLGLRPGSSITVAQAILAVITKSANDAAVVLAEAIGGTEQNFAEIMNETARKIGMNNSQFRNASGLPNTEQFTTARDMSTLSLALVYDYPQFYSLFATRRFAYGSTVAINHNHLLGVVDGVDGIKTGFISTAGFNLAASAQRNGKRLVVIVMGGTTPANRDRRVAELFTAGFSVLNNEIDSLDEDEALSIPNLISNTKNDDDQGETTEAALTPATDTVQIVKDKDVKETAATSDPDKKLVRNSQPEFAPRRNKIEDLTATAAANNVSNLNVSENNVSEQLSASAPAFSAENPTNPAFVSNRDSSETPEMITASTIEAAARANLEIPDHLLKSRSKKYRNQALRATKAALWAVQVGAFNSAPAARRAAANFSKISDAGSVKILPKRGSKPWRVRIIGLARQQAVDVCNNLSQNGHQCMVIPGQTS
ncbi:MAG: D-alanyl-D-alanine carboxypeptidase [Alphaproteobacteria bacterium]|nr:D-alanyl-D-alanine carboxypeptidase [Alphaproteobacteria bacterium]